MFGFIVRRLLAAVLVLFLTSLFTFSLFYKFSPVNPAENVCWATPKTCTPAKMAQLTNDFGRNDSVWTNYTKFVKGLVHDREISRGGNTYQCEAPCLDISLNLPGQEVRKMFVEHYPATLSLAVGGALLYLIIGIPIGVLAAKFRGSAFDKVSVGATLIVAAIPYYVFALVAWIYLSLQTNIFPTTGYFPITENPAKWLGGMLLPWLVLGVTGATTYVRYTRGQMLESMGDDYVRTAKAKGLGEWRVLFRHALRVAIVPIVTIFGLDFAALLSGTIFTEMIFQIDGIGRWTILSLKRAVRTRLPDRQCDRAHLCGLCDPGEPDRRSALCRPRPESEARMTTPILTPGTAHAPGVAGVGGTEPLLVVENLTVEFPTYNGLVHAVTDLSYSVGAGKTLGIVGESGSGKSVSSMAILGLHDTRSTRLSGSIRFDGREVVGMSDGDLRKIRGNDVAMIFQDALAALHPFYSVGSQIVEAYRIHNDVSKKAARARAIEMLDRVGIPQPDRRVDDFPHQFSGGMRQRAMIAMALVNDPKLIIADEPTTALDVTVQAQILDLLQDLQREFNSTIIIITHDLGVIAEMADDVLVMYAGRAVEYGPAREVLVHPDMPYTWGLLSSIPEVTADTSAKLRPIPGTPPSLLNPPSGCAFHPRCTFKDQVPGDLCSTVLPELLQRPTSPDHLKRCHLVDPSAIYRSEVIPEIAPDKAKDLQ